ncbi:thioesterase domain-containing protein, partial [Acinetobacter baumannii]
ILEKEQQYTSSRDCVVPIKVVPHKKNIFLIHPIGGTIHRFQAFANLIPDICSIYGIEDPGLHSDKYFFESLEAMANFYIKKIKEVQPLGP